MSKIYLVIVAFFILNHSYGQTSETTDTAHKTRYGIWVTPVTKNTTINGIAMGLMAIPMRKAEILIINGLNIEASPFSVLGGVMFLMGSILSPFDTSSKGTTRVNVEEIRDFFPFYVDSIFTNKPKSAINGLSISTGLSGIDKLSGVAVNGITSSPYQMNGVEITGLINFHYSFKGFIVAGFRNKTTFGEGLQIGLFNSCREGKVVQIGLLNRIGKRIMPLLNFKLKD